MSKKMVLIKWVDAKFCSGIHTEEEALDIYEDAIEAWGRD